MNFNEYREHRDSVTVGQKLYFISVVLDHRGVPFQEFWEKHGMPVILEHGYQSTDELLDQLLREAARDDISFGPEEYDSPIPPPNIPAQGQPQGNAAGNVLGLMTGTKIPAMAGQGWNNVVDWGAKQMGYDPQNAPMWQKALMGAAKTPGHLAQVPQMGVNWAANKLTQPGGFTDQMAGIAGNAAAKFADQYQNYQGGRPAFVNAWQSGGRTTAGPQQAQPEEAAPEAAQDTEQIQQLPPAGHLAVNTPGSTPVTSGSGLPATGATQATPNMQTLQQFNTALGALNDALAKTQNPGAPQIAQQLQQAADGAQKLLSGPPAQKGLPAPQQPTPAIRGMSRI